MKIQLAFYKGKGTIVNTIIRWWTRSDYSHIEMIIGNRWVGSVSGKGIISNPLRPLDNDDWNYIELDVDGRKNGKAQRFIDEQSGKGYDNWGVFLGGGFSIPVDEKDKWYCSEYIAEILYAFDEPSILGTKEDSSTITPEDLYKIYN